jgi:hypothetical protein
MLVVARKLSAPRRSSTSNDSMEDVAIAEESIEIRDFSVEKSAGIGTRDVI